MRHLFPIVLCIVSCREQRNAEVDAAPRPDLVVAADVGPEVVEKGPDVADAVAQLEALEETGLDVGAAGAAIEATLGAAKVTPKGALDPGAVLARDRFRFRACARALPDAGTAKVVLTIKVGEGGDVVSVAASDKSAIAECLRDAAERMRFDEPKGGSAVVEVPVDVARR